MEYPADTFKAPPSSKHSSAYFPTQDVPFAKVRLEIEYGHFLMEKTVQFLGRYGFLYLFFQLFCFSVYFSLVSAHLHTPSIPFTLFPHEVT